MLNAVTIVGHRGSPCSAPENTLASFRQAIDIGVDYIEFDVHLTKDGVPVVLHDVQLGRNVNVASPCGVNCLTLNELKYYDAGSLFHHDFRGESVPTLEEVFEAAHEKVGMMIEIKTGTASEKRLADAVMQVIKSRQKSEKPILVGSFSSKVLECVREIDPQQPIIALSQSVETIDHHFRNNPEYYGLKWTIASPDLVQMVHEQGKKIWVWTVNEEKEMVQLVKMGVDGLISNRPMAMKECKKMIDSKLPL